MKWLRFVPVIALVLIGMFTTTNVAGADNQNPGSTYNCTGASGGIVPPGTYDSMIITGVCYIPAGTVTVRGNLTVAPGALLDAAATLGDPTDNPNPILPGTLVVGGNVNVGHGAVLTIGCSPAGGCHGITNDRIGGNLTAFGALGVLVQHVSIGGSASVIGGGGGVVGGASSGACFLDPIPAPWSEDAALSQGQNGSPQYTDFEDSSIGGNLSVIGVQTCYLASFRDQVRGSFTFIGNATSDPDGMEVGSNLVGGNMTCLSNLPAVQFGDSGAAPNVVGGWGIGQCGFNVMQVNPVANPDLPQNFPPFHPAGPPEHISVSAWSLRTFYGTHTQTQTNSLNSMLGPNVTESGDTLFAALNSDVLAGTGLTGSISAVFPPTMTAPLGSTGEILVGTEHVDGSESFEASDNCTCSFDGQSGPVTIEAYGTTSDHGVTDGTFLIVSGGALYGGGLDALAGYGTFSSWGEPAGTLRLVEHLGITGATGGPPSGHDHDPDLGFRDFPRR